MEAESWECRLMCFYVDFLRGGSGLKLESRCGLIDGSREVRATVGPSNGNVDRAGKTKKVEEIRYLRRTRGEMVSGRWRAIQSGRMD